MSGRNPGPIARSGEPDPRFTPIVPAGLPSDLLFRRPDILQAEQQLIASNALIGAARALFFPRISLTGLFGLASGSLGNLFSGSARTWSFTGDVVGPIYTGGGLTAAVDQAEARRDQSLANYELVIQNAFRDVEDALADVRHSAELRETLWRRVATLRRGVELANERYENGYSDYLEVLDTERSLFAAELQLASARGDYQRALVNLYRALGGDWTSVPPAAASSAQTRDEQAMNDTAQAAAAQPVATEIDVGTAAPPAQSDAQDHPDRAGAAAHPVRLSRAVRPLHALHLASAGRGLPDPDRAGGRRRCPGSRSQGQWRGQEGPAAVPDRSRTL